MIMDVPLSSRHSPAALLRRNSSGSFATLAAIRRASSFVRSVVADCREGLTIDPS